MFQGVSPVDGSQPVEGVLRDAVQALLAIQVPLTPKAGNPSLYVISDSPEQPKPSPSPNPAISFSPFSPPPPPPAPPSNPTSPYPTYSSENSEESPVKITPVHLKRSFRQVSMGVYGIWKDT